MLPVWHHRCYAIRIEGTVVAGKEGEIEKREKRGRERGIG
jgi:hypothetical protein